MYPGESRSLNPEAPEVVKIIDIEKGWNLTHFPRMA